MVLIDDPTPKRTSTTRPGKVSSFDLLQEALRSKNPTYRVLASTKAFVTAVKSGVFKDVPTKRIARTLGVSVSYYRIISHLWPKLGSSSNREYAFANYESIRVVTLAGIAKGKRMDYRRVKNLLAREVNNIERAKYGSKKAPAGSKCPETGASLGNWGSSEATAGFEQYAEVLHQATKLRTRVTKTDSGVVEVSFKCLVEHDLDRLLSLLQGFRL